MLKRAGLLLACLMMTAAMASAEPKIFYARVPFPFVVHDTRFPAGNYVIRFDNHLLNLRVDKLVAVFSGEPNQYSTTEEPELKFKMTSEGPRLCIVPGVLTNYCK